MVRASMAKRNKKDVTTDNDIDVQLNDEVNMVKFPRLHRRAIAVIAVLVLVIFFWPSSEKPPATPQNTELPVPIAPSVTNQNATENPIDLNTLPSANDSLNAQQGVATPDNTENTNGDATTPSTEPTTQQPTSSSQWNTYTIREGQTLAQLFRDNQLPVNDAFSMAKSEDQQKSLSQLRAGQSIRLQRSPQGDVSMLEVTNNAGTVITYTRLSDGSYYRTP